MKDVEIYSAVVYKFMFWRTLLNMNMIKIANNYKPSEFGEWINLFDFGFFIILHKKSLPTKADLDQNESQNQVKNCCIVFKCLRTRVPYHWYEEMQIVWAAFRQDNHHMLLRQTAPTVRLSKQLKGAPLFDEVRRKLQLQHIWSATMQLDCEGGNVEIALVLHLSRSSWKVCFLWCRSTSRQLFWGRCQRLYFVDAFPSPYACMICLRRIQSCFWQP